MIRSLPNHVTYPPYVTLPNHKLLYIGQLLYLIQETHFRESSKHFSDWHHIIYHPLCFLVVFAIRTINYLYDMCLVLLSIK